MNTGNTHRDGEAVRTQTRKEAGHWKTTVLRGQRRLYVTPDAATKENAEQLARQFIEQLKP